MIAKLPGKSVPLGDKLEIVCLLQAAEIERLSDSLEEYHVKYEVVYRIGTAR